MEKNWPKARVGQIWPGGQNWPKGQNWQGDQNWPGGQNWPKARILDGKSKN